MHGQAPRVGLGSTLALLALAVAPLSAHAAGGAAARPTRDEPPSVSLPTAWIGPTITVQLPDGGHVFSQGTCGAAPGAVFELADCDSMRIGLRLDNSSAARATRYRWTERDLAGQVATRVVDVGAGDVVDVEVPLVDGSRVGVDVTVGGTALVVTSDWRACRRFAADLRASLGVVDCSDV